MPETKLVDWPKNHFQSSIISNRWLLPGQKDQKLIFLKLLQLLGSKMFLVKEFHFTLITGNDILISAQFYAAAQSYAGSTIITCVMTVA